jgi:kinesin family member 2/24
MSSSKINVYFRKKPFVPLVNNDIDIIKTKENTIYVKNLKPRVSDKSQYVEFNAPLLSHDYKNKDIYGATIQEDFNNKKNILLMAYGQTGSGKTHTLCGNNNEEGIIPIVIKNLLKAGLTCKFKVIEVYCNNIYDLQTSVKIPLAIYESNKRLKYKTAPVVTDINTLDDLNNAIIKINKNKMMGCTKINQTSSRSHTIYYFSINNSQQFIAIDLAGNERGYLTRAKNSVENQEYISINQSLFALKECIRSIFLNRPYIPFRRSKLTLLLRDLLNKTINIHFIGTLNPSRLCYPDIIDTIEYGSCLKYSKLKKILKHVPSEQFLTLPKIDLIKSAKQTNNKSEDNRPSTSVHNKQQNSEYIRNIKSEPTMKKDEDFLKRYHKFILAHYLIARKHAKIYNSLSLTNDTPIPNRQIKILLKRYTEARGLFLNS